MNFTDYWKQNKELYEQLGVTEAVARKIWSDCADNIERRLLNTIEEKYDRHF